VSDALRTAALEELPELPTTVMACGSVVALAAATGEPIDASQRKDLLTRVRAGEPVTLRLSAVTYLQPSDEPNLNYVRFREGLLSAFATSFKGKPVLRDHDQNRLESRAGTIRSSKKVDVDGVPGIEMELELVKPWAVESALDGTLDRFSIGWSAPRARGNLLCTVCRGVMGWYGWCENDHVVGNEYVLEDKKADSKAAAGKPIAARKVVCEAEYQQAAGVEVSAVNVPAVNGTGIDRIRRAALAATQQRAGARKGAAMGPLAMILGLAATASEDELAGAAEKTMGELKAAREQLDRLGKEAEGLRAQLADRDKAARQAASDAVVEKALASGKLLPQMPELESYLRSLDPRVAEETLARMPKLAPIGSEPVSRTEREAPPAQKPGQLSEKQVAFLKAHGISDETIQKHGAQALADLGGKHAADDDDSDGED
jgi:hypothetical protein